MILHQKLINIPRKPKIVKESSVMQIKRAEVRNLMLEIQSWKSKVENFAMVGFWILMFGCLMTGCNSQQTKSYDKSTLITYTELTLLYEKEKMTNKQTDSSYVIKVNEFFVSKGIEQIEFKKRIETISQDEEMWKIFIQDVSTAMDSLKKIETAK